MATIMYTCENEWNKYNIKNLQSYYQLFLQSKYKDVI